MSKQDFSVIILAAGKGTRMSSPLPKVLHPVAGWPMIHRILSALNEAGASDIRVVVGYGENLVRPVVESMGARCFVQKEQKGTAHAVLCAEPDKMSGTVLIINGDHPLVQANDIISILQEHKETRASLSVVSTQLRKPKNFGRVVRHKGELVAIVEAKDASSETLKINEVNTGIYVADAELLKTSLPKVSNHNAQKEFYLTDLISIAKEESLVVKAIRHKARVAFGVNNQAELAQATRWVFKKNCQKLFDKGVIIIDPNSTYIEDDVEIGEASVIYPGCYIRNKSIIGKYCVLEPNCYLSKAEIGDSVQVRSGTYIEEASVGNKSVIGPYARLRPKTKVGVEAKVGNFVEMKNVVFKDRAQASHLTYLGDAEVGESTNIGCGVITCNYAPDRKKYFTQIGKNSFIGSDCQFIAPISVGDNVTIGSGSTITKDVPDDALSVARGRQVIKENYMSSATKKKD